MTARPFFAHIQGVFAYGAEDMFHDDILAHILSLRNAQIKFIRSFALQRSATCYTESMLELLAPAGDIKSFDAAVNCGADAVYLGLKGFNARMKADNFDGDGLREAVRRAHFFGVKVYVTLNTIAQNQEFNDILSLVKMAVEAKVDAFIVQDVGLCALLRSAFEGIELHASTQMGVHNFLGAKTLEDMGVKRAVLSRETTLDDIRRIREGTSLQLEYFVQGALCVCFSGNCYLSAVEQGASGNRGLCKQLCRLPYAASVGDFKKAGYLLSARDLCLADSVRQLAEAGVTSFKIEGRMRREGYVAQTVKIYRRILDGERDKLSSDDLFKLKAAFSRGDYLYRGYLDGGVPSVVEARFNNHSGVKIGAIAAVRPFKKGLFEVDARLSRPIADGDGIKLFDGDREAASLGVGGVKELGGGMYRFVTATAVKAGWQVALILDSRAEREALSTTAVNHIAMKVSAVKGSPLKIAARFADKKGVDVSVEKCGQVPLEEAKNAPMSADMIREQASKTLYGGFVTDVCEVDTDGVFVPKSALNALRREVVDELAAKIIRARERDVAQTDYVLPPFGEGRADVAGTIAFVTEEDAKSGVYLRAGETVALSPSRYSADNVRQTLSLLDLDESEVALDLPPLASGEDIQKITDLLSALPNVKTLVANNLYGLQFAKRGYTVIAGEGMNISNDLAAREVVRLGAAGVVPSLEFKDGISNMAGVKVFAARGDRPLMTLAHCPFKTLFGNDCEHCSFKAGLTLSREKHRYKMRRVQISRCQFELYPIRDK